jgi:GNAT superfamily N-acetyltransferase
MPAFSVRRATLKDLQVLVSQRHGMFEDIRHRPPGDHEVGDESYRAWARRKMKSGELVGYLATDRTGRVVAGGCVWLKEEQPGPGFPGGPIPYVMSMYTEPEFRRMGLATLILKRMARDARKDGRPWMTLHASKYGRKVYPRLGWKRGWEMYLDLE